MPCTNKDDQYANLFAQTFCNSYVGNGIYAIQCVQEHLVENVIASKQRIGNWKCVTNIEYLYKGGKIKGRTFAIQ